MSAPLNLAQLITFLLDAPMFGDLDEAELSQIVHIMQVQHLRPGQVLFEQGQPGQAWYVLHEGTASVEIDTGDGPHVIRELKPQMCFGEMAILDDSPRSATVRAVSEARVLRFPRKSFNELLQQDNLAAYKLVLQMARVLVARQRKTTSQLVEVLAATPAPSVRKGIAPIVERHSTSE